MKDGMSKAEQMFKELGYERDIGLYDDFIEYGIYYTENINGEIIKCQDDITFWLKNKTYSAEEFKTVGWRGIEITAKLHQAITQQMRELGWL